eukprot:EG_transcript_20217
MPCACECCSCSSDGNCVCAECFEFSVWLLIALGCMVVGAVIIFAVRYLRQRKLLRSLRTNGTPNTGIVRSVQLFSPPTGDPITGTPIHASNGSLLRGIPFPYQRVPAGSPTEGPADEATREPGHPVAAAAPPAGPEVEMGLRMPRTAAPPPPPGLSPAPF